MSDKLVPTERRNGMVTVSSIEVAKDFHKDHKHVMESIGKIQASFQSAQKSADYGEYKDIKNYFVPDAYVDRRNRKQPMYQMTRDGFQLLAMGFTGEAALHWKLKYIETFDKMENAIREVVPIPHDSYMIENPIERAEAWIKEQKRLQLAESKVKELKPKADYCTKILDNPGLIPITSIAKDYGMSGQEFNKRLHEFGIQYKRGSQWFLYEKYQACGYVSSKPVPITHSDGTKDVKPQTKWTQKGRKFLYDFLKEQGILPVIEREPFIQIGA